MFARKRTTFVFFFLNTRKCALVCVREELFKTEEKVLASKKLFPSLSYDETVLPRLSLSLFLFFSRDASSSTRSQPLEVVDTTRLSLRIFFFLRVSVFVVSLLSLSQRPLFFSICKRIARPSKLFEHFK